MRFLAGNQTILVVSKGSGGGSGVSDADVAAGLTTGERANFRFGSNLDLDPNSFIIVYLLVNNLTKFILFFIFSSFSNFNW